MKSGWNGNICPALLINNTYNFFLYLEKEIFFHCDDVSMIKSSKFKRWHALLLNSLNAIPNTLLLELNMED